jgi:5-formyltetrahydrofolate cyclo-ligase
MNYSLMPDKTMIRNQLKSVRDALPFKERREKDYHITTHLRKFLQSYQTVFAYASKDSEVESFVIINSLLEDGKKVIVPIIQTSTKTLRLSYLKRIEDLKPGTFRVPEPLSADISVSAETIEIALLPLVGFDRSGNRLGYGAGYYDRFFEAYPDIPCIGLAYACQEIPVIPTDLFDRKMNWVVTENGFIACNSARPMF